MKNILYLYILIPFCLFSQNETKVWRMAAITMTFEQDTIIIDTLFGSSGMMYTNASICDKRGKLLFYTNGINIWNANNDIVTNGNEIITGSIAQNQSGTGMTVLNGAFFLPAPEDSSSYYLFHESVQYLMTGSLPFQLFCTKINKDIGEGSVTDRMKVVINDTIAWGGLSAVKHSNGTDWWVVVPVSKNNQYYRLLVTSKGILGPYSQFIGTNHYVCDGGAAVFSPDGTKYARFDLNASLIYIYDFDRCRGLLSNPVVIPLSTGGSMGGLSISPNSRYLYATTAFAIYQFDLQSNNIPNSKTNVAQYDGFYDDIGNGAHLSTIFSVPQLAVNNKIYITSSNTHYMHIIHTPDSAGVAANVQQHALYLPYQNTTIPNLVNYSLGAAATQCDTVFYATAIESPQEKEILSLYPNPAQDEIHLSFSQKLVENVLFSLRDLQGRVVFTQTLREGSEDFVLEMGDLAKGMYFWEAREEGKLLQAGKLLRE